MTGLVVTSTEYEPNVTRLYGILLKMAYTEARRKGARIQPAGPELDDIAHQAAADAKLTICRKVADFRGDCKFTTWHVVSGYAFDRRHRLQDHVQLGAR